MKFSYKLNVESDLIKVNFDSGNEKVIKSQVLPKPFLEWQHKARINMFELLNASGSASIKSMPAHLPTLATLNENGYPVNLTTKGIGILPNKTIIEEVTSTFEDVREKTKELSWEDSLQQRVAVAKEFYSDIKNFDQTLLGGLEIFMGQTAQNICVNPFVSLLFTGQAPIFPSYQFNGVMQIVGEEDQHYKFLLAARELFAKDHFHIHQTNYPFGYLFHLEELKNKTPYSKNHHRG